MVCSLGGPCRLPLYVLGVPFFAQHTPAVPPPLSGNKTPHCARWLLQCSSWLRTLGGSMAGSGKMPGTIWLR